MNWKDDLAALLADVAMSTPGQAVGGVLGSAPVQGAFNVLNAPLAGAQFGTGALIGGINRGLGALDAAGVPGAGFAYEPLTEAAFSAGGPRAAWDQVRSEEPLWFQAPTELLLDPTTYTGIGAAGDVAKALRAREALQAAAGHGGMARGLGGLAKTYEVAQGINDVPRHILEGIPVGGRRLGIQPAVTNVADRFRGSGTGLLDLSPESQLDQEIGQVYNALADAEASGAGVVPIGTTTPLRIPLSKIDGTFLHPGLTFEQNDLLARQLEDGRTYGTYLEETASLMDESQKKLRASGVDWKAKENSLDEWLKAVKGKPNEAENAKIVREWHKAGYDPLHTDSPFDTAVHMLDGQLRKERDIRTSGKSYKLSLLGAAWGETALASVSNQTNNISGNIMMSLVSGKLDWSYVNPANYFRNFKLMNAGANKLERNRLLAGLKSTEVEQRFGGAHPPHEVLNQGGFQDVVGARSESAVGELVTRATGSERFGKAVSKPFVYNNRFSQAADLVPRDAIYSDMRELTMAEGLTKWEDAVRQEVPGLDFAAFGKPSSPPSLAAGPLKRHLESLGINRGSAERLTRDYVELNGASRKAAITEMNKTQFSYLRTNLDKHFKTLGPFHYWYSRALRFWGEAAFRNPSLMTNYMRSVQGIEDAQHDPGLNARQKGFLRIVGTPLGYSLLMNPDSLFGVVKVFGMDQPENPNADPNAAWHDAPPGMTPLGGVLDWMKNKGMPIYPWYDAMFNMMGLYGNTFEPDFLPIRQKGLVGAAVNFAMAQAGAAPPGTPYQNAMGQARWALSSAASQFLPGWIAQPVAPKAGGSTQEASLETIIENIVLTDNPGISGERLMAIMSDPQSPEYNEAYKKASTAGIIQQLLSFTLPVRVNLRNDAKDVLTAQKDVFEDAAARAGVAPFQFQPKVGDLQFAADYKRLTGKDWKPGDYENAKFQMDVARAPDGDAKRFIFEEQAYQQLGTETDRAIFKTFNALRYGDDPRTAGLPFEAADQMARTWLDRTGGADSISRIYDLRDAFSARHPAYAAFLDWQDKMRQIQGTYGDLSEYRRQASAQNPNAARYFAEKDDYLQRVRKITDTRARQLALDEETMSASAYQAITGMGMYRSQEGAIPGAPRFDTALPGMLPAAPPQTPYNPQENWMSQLAQSGRSYGLRTFGG